MKRMTLRALLVVTIAIAATACSSGNHDDLSVREVNRTLAAAQLAPQKVKVVITIATTSQLPAPRVNYCAAGAAKVPAATSLDVDRGRAIVMVFASRRDAAEWTPMPECRAKPLRVANVIAVPTHGTLSRRLRQALARFR